MRNISSFSPRRLILIGLGISLLLVLAAAMPGSAGLQSSRAAPPAMNASTLTFYAIADATVHSNAPNSNFGYEPFLRLGYSNIDTPIEYVVILRFDLTGLPAGAIIDSASLELFLSSAAGNPAQPLAVKYVTSQWYENTVTWNNFPTVQPQFPLSWTMDNLTGRYRQLYITAWAEYWRSHPGENFGVMLQRSTSNTSYFDRIFESKDHNEWMPRLVVEYHFAPTATHTPTNTRVIRPTNTPTNTSVPFTNTPTFTRTATNTPTATQPAPTLTRTPTPTQPSGPLPDLIITDLWPAEERVCLQIQNIGGGPAPAGHRAALWIDGIWRADLLVESVLGPGDRWNGCFAERYECTMPGNLLTARADQTDVVAESNELNNGREKSWLCDTQPPRFLSGPNVFNITQTSADVSWMTDEPADGRARYGPLAGSYPFEQWAGVEQSHQLVHLESLAPATTYHLSVEVVDPYGNVTNSREVHFETQPPADSQAPTVELILPDRFRERVTVLAQTADDTGVERVEFYFDSRLVFTDYAPPFEMQLDSLRYANGRYTITARAHDLARRYTDAVRPIDVLNVVDATAPQVSIIAPAAGATVGGVVTVTALLTDDVGIINARFYVDGVYGGFDGWPTESAPAHTTFTLNWDTRKLQAGKTYRLAVQAYDTTFKTGLATVDVIVQQTPTPTPQPDPPYLEVTDHIVSRLQNLFTIQLKVKNTGDLDATNVRILDGLRAFQSISNTTGAADIFAAWIPAGDYGYADIRPKNVIPAGQERIYTYNVIPVLVYPNPPTPQIGFFTDLSWNSATASGYHSFVTLPPAKTDANETIAAAHQNAVATCNYLLVTDPYRLAASYCSGCYGGMPTPAEYRVNAILANMAELARYRRGALGYIYTGNAGQLHVLVSPAGAWASKLHADFGTVGKGYLLIVGETNIISSYNWNNWNMQWSGGSVTNKVMDSDQCIADTSGDARPELAIGRIVGQQASQLAATLRRDIQVATGAAGHVYDHSHALSVSGVGNGQSTMVTAANNTGNTLTGLGYTTSILHWSAITTTQRLQAFVNVAPNRDIIYIFEHGNPDGPGPLDSWMLGSVNFGTTHPFLLSASCRTGDYTNGDFVEAIFDRGVGAGVASTQDSPMSVNAVCGIDLYGGGITSDAAGKLLLNVKRNYWDKGKVYQFWSAEYNFYGDPKYGAGLNTLAGIELVQDTAAATPIPTPPASLSVEVPMYEVNTIEDLDYAQIPGGAVWLEPGDYQIPYYSVVVPMPAGARVQDVTLAQKSDLQTAFGIRLPVAVADKSCCADPRLGAADAGNLPFAGKDYAWKVVGNPDGSANLIIDMYPFVYNPLTAGVAFYRTYRFELQTSQSPLSITALEVPGAEHRLGEPALVNLTINNQGEPQDVAVNAVVKRAGGGDSVGGLLLRTLQDLAGAASFTAAWDSAGAAPGVYEVEVTLSDPQGSILEQRAVTFLLGVAGGELSDFSVTPARFDVGDVLRIAYSFQNTGDLPATGAITLRVSDSTGAPITQFIHELEGVEPGSTVGFSDEWASAGAPAGRYFFTLQALFDGASAGPLTRTASSYRHGYLPLQLKR